MNTHTARPSHEPRRRARPRTGLLALLVLPCVIVVAACASDDPECYDELSCEELDRREEEEELALVRRDAGRDAGGDAGRDAGRDAGPDAGRDAGRDAGPDAGRDAARPPLWPW